MSFAPLALSGIVLALVAVVLVVVLGNLRAARAIREAAEALRLEYREGGLFVPGDASGIVDDQAIDISQVNQGLGSFQRTVTLIDVHLHPRIYTRFHLGHENVLSRSSKVFGVRDIEFGDRVFDDLFLVRGEVEEAVRALLVPEARQALVNFAAAASDIEVTPERFRWQVNAAVRDPKVLVDAVRAACDAARIMRRGER